MKEDTKKRAFQAIEDYVDKLPGEIDENKFKVWVKTNRPDIYYENGKELSDQDIKGWLDEYNQS